jgi:rhodanese-related sulfurtransferase
MLSDALADAGFTGVKRYQLGLPVWRALSGLVEIVAEGDARILGVDKTAVFFDARDADAFARGSVPGAHNVPASGLVDGQVQNAPFPNTDFNTRVVIFGADGAQARTLAEAVSRTAYTNASYYSGTYDELREALKLP